MAKTPDLDLSIDELRLQEEWKKHSDQFHNWAIAEAEANDAVDTATSDLDLVKAEMEAEIRGNLDKYKLPKAPTGTAITAVMMRMSEYKIAQAKLTKAVSRQRKIGAVVKSLVERRISLSKLTDLWIRDYYSDAGVGKMDRKYDDDMDDIRSRVRDRQRRRDNDDA